MYVTSGLSARPGTTGTWAAHQRGRGEGALSRRHASPRTPPALVSLPLPLPRPPSACAAAKEEGAHGSGGQGRGRQREEGGGSTWGATNLGDWEHHDRPTSRLGQWEELGLGWSAARRLACGPPRPTGRRGICVRGRAKASASRTRKRERKTQDRGTEKLQVMHLHVMPCRVMPRTTCMHMYIRTNTYTSFSLFPFFSPACPVLMVVSRFTRSSLPLVLLGEPLLLRAIFVLQ